MHCCWYLQSRTFICSFFSLLCHLYPVHIRWLKIYMILFFIYSFIFSNYISWPGSLGAHPGNAGHEAALDPGIYHRAPCTDTVTHLFKSRSNLGGNWKNQRKFTLILGPRDPQTVQEWISCELAMLPVVPTFYSTICIVMYSVQLVCIVPIAYTSR